MKAPVRPGGQRWSVPREDTSAVVMGTMGLSLLSVSCPLNLAVRGPGVTSIQPQPRPQTVFAHLLPPEPNGGSRPVNCTSRSLWFVVREGGSRSLSQRRLRGVGRSLRAETQAGPGRRGGDQPSSQHVDSLYWDDGPHGSLVVITTTGPVSEFPCLTITGVLHGGSVRSVHAAPSLVGRRTEYTGVLGARTSRRLQVGAA